MNKINATIIEDSITEIGHRITTMEIIFPRFILAEFNTHRLFSRNSASSRAIPFKKMLTSVKENPFIPIAWQKDHTGMQGTQYIEDSKEAEKLWLEARDFNIGIALNMSEKLSVTKQMLNRLLEPYMYHKVLVTATEYENFFSLRCPVYEHPSDRNVNFKSWKDLINYYEEKYEDFWTGLQLENYSPIERLKLNKGMGEIHIMDLAEKMYDAMHQSIPKILKPGEWHIPYKNNIDPNISEEDKLKISVARCARLSYQTLGDNPVVDHKKDLELFDILKNSGHFSPFEHIARAMTDDEYYRSNKGIASTDIWSELYFNKEDKGWNNNFRGFMQYRWLLENS